MIQGAWGGALLESDQDQDILCSITGELGEESYQRPTDILATGVPMRKDDETPEKVKAKLDAGAFNRLFDKFKNEDTRTTGMFFMASGSYHCVILAVLAAQVGARISDEQKEYLRSKYKAVGLYKEGIWQFGKLLDNYKTGLKYNLEEPDRTEANARSEEMNRSDLSCIDFELAD